MPQSLRLKKALQALRKSNEFLEKINSHFQSSDSNDEDFEKSLGKNRAPQKRPTKITSSVAFEGHIGTGVRPSAKSTMVNKIISSIELSQFEVTRFELNKANKILSKDNMRLNTNLKLQKINL